MLDRGFFIVALAPGVVVGSPMVRPWGGPYPQLGSLLMLLGVGGLLVVNVALLGRGGQTLAKRFVGVRIVDQGGGPADAWQLLGLRVAAPLLIAGVSSFVPAGPLLWWLCDALFIVSSERRCLHDRLAGTTVVPAEVNPYVR
ncbi:MAG: RDD family protein [Alphaproteobacteria bacterium]|nr:RDD family protein [Alphaproteobacteria bacterium]MCB9793215.1 RDD family protein [Alphaproteobacteria bacterium]